MTISKRIEGEDIETERQFAFVITLSTDKGSLRGSYPYQKSIGGFESGRGTFASGSKITLKHNETITVSGMPEGTRYTVTEAKTTGYTSSLDDGSDKVQGQLFGESGKTVRFVNTKEVKVPEEPTSSTETMSQEESTDPSDPTAPTEPDNPSSGIDPTGSTDPTGPTSPTDPTSPTEPTTPAEPTKRSHTGGGGNDPAPKSSTEATTQPETPAESAADINPATESGIDPDLNPGSETGQLPDPNDPDSPESVVIMEEGVPRTYLKVWNPEEETWVYLPEDEVPLAWLLPPTSDESRDILWVLLYLTSLGGIAVLVWTEWWRRERK